MFLFYPEGCKIKEFQEKPAIFNAYKIALTIQPEQIQKKTKSPEDFHLPEKPGKGEQLRDFGILQKIRNSGM